MFKRTSDNSLSRTNRQAEFGRQNEAGVDPSTFHSHPKANLSQSIDKLERARMVEGHHKQEIEEALASCKVQIARAERAFHSRSETALSRQLYLKLQKDHDDLHAKIIESNRKLRELNLAIADQRRAERNSRPTRDRRETFGAVFYEVAKEMLAQQVLNRLTAATIHRIGERLDEGRHPEAHE